MSLNAALENPKNSICADCGEGACTYASVNYGVFVCDSCSEVHRRFNQDVRLLSTANDGLSWSNVLLTRFLETGNNVAVNARLENELPDFYKRAWNVDCPQPIRDSFFIDKYIREIFKAGAREKNQQNRFTQNRLEVPLLKMQRGRNKFLVRYFSLDVERNTLEYFIHNNSKVPKESINLEKCNMFFVNHGYFDVPPNTAILQFIQNDEYRSIFIRSEESQTIVDFYNNFRYGKYRRMRTNISAGSEAMRQLDISSVLTFDVLLAGYLWKTGPGPNTQWRRRWCMLIHRILFYQDDPIAANPKGSIFLPYESNSIKVIDGLPDDWNRCPSAPHHFFFEVNDRLWVFGAENPQARECWSNALKHVFANPLTETEQLTKMYSQNNSRR